MYYQKVEEFIKEEFPLLRDTCYLDHTGATLYAKGQIEAFCKDLCGSIYGNPHSLNTSSRYCSDVIDQVRYRILHHFNTNVEEYSVIFTSGATAALKLVADSFDWRGNFQEEDFVVEKGIVQLTMPNFSTDEEVSFLSQEKKRETRINEENGPNRSSADHECTPKYNGNCGSFFYLQDNHTSVLGMREIAAKEGARIKCVSHDDAFDIFQNQDRVSEIQEELTYSGNSLFAYPAQCNFSGVKYPLSWIEKVQHGVLDKVNLLKQSDTDKPQHTRWFCLLDAATYTSTNQLDLSLTKPDFVCVSFYKMFGYPTGVGALLVKNSSANSLKKVYFGGGTVLISLSSEQFHVPRPLLSDRFEDGTIPFLSIIALQHGFNTIERLVKSMSNITQHTFYLSRYVHKHLLELHHANGSPVAVLYCDTDYADFNTQGNIVNFNLLRPNGEYVGFVEVLNMANLYGIHLRTGCFCNPGACQRHLGLSGEELRQHFQAGHVCGDERDLIEGLPTGSVRVSFGYMSSKRDADKLLHMITKCFVCGPAVIKIPEWWPLFRRTYKDKFYSQSLKPRTSIGNVKEHPLECGFVIESVNAQNDETHLPNPVCKEHIHQNGDNGLLNNEEGSKLLEENNSGEHIISQLHSTGEENNDMYDTLTVQEGNEDQNETKYAIHLSQIFLYPIKSCGAVSVRSWLVGPRGLMYDREWMIVTPSGVSLTQKQETKLCLIQPSINLDNKQMTLHFPGLSSISLPLDQPATHFNKEVSLCQSKVCGDYVQCWDCGDDIAVWLTTALHRDGLRLIRQWNNDLRAHKSKKKHIISESAEENPSLSLSNQAQFLLLNQASIQWLHDKLEEENANSQKDLLKRFRCNLVVEGLQPLEENDCSELLIGDIHFFVDGPCTRCQIICIDQSTGEKTQEPLRTLSAAFHGKMRFGIYLKHLWNGEERKISVGNAVTLISETSDV